MADKRNRRRFTPEFKAQAVKRVLDGRKDGGEQQHFGMPPGPRLHEHRRKR